MNQPFSAAKMDLEKYWMVELIVAKTPSSQQTKNLLWICYVEFQAINLSIQFLFISKRFYGFAIIELFGIAIK